MEAAILAVEGELPARRAHVERAANAGHAALGEACRELEECEGRVHKLYARWEALEAKRK